MGKEIITREEWALLPGEMFFEPNETCNKVAVIERHKASGRTGKAVETLPLFTEIRILPRGLYRVEDGSFYREDEEQ